MHHLPTLYKVRCAVINPSVRISDGVSKLMFYEVRPYLQHFVKDCTSNCPETMTGNFGVAVQFARFIKIVMVFKMIKTKRFIVWIVFQNQQLADLWEARKARIPPGTVGHILGHSH
jgi:hypothetical protein